MNEITNIVLTLVQRLPAVQASLREIFKKDDPTDADWDAEREKWKKDYYAHVPESKLPRSP